MTTEEITQALECCKSESLLDCERCPLYAKKVGFAKCHTELLNLTFDLVRRQNKTIELLKRRVNMAKITVPIDVNLDIHQVIDDAIAKKDRRVCIFITDTATSINVEPFENDGRRDWQTVYCDLTDSVGHTLRRITGHDCPECGHRVSKRTPYCPMCGEALKGE